MVHENNTTFLLLLDIPLLISTRITFAALFTAPYRVCIQWVVHNPPSVLDTTAVWQKTFAFCLYLMSVLPCWTYDFAFDFAVEQALFIKKPESGSTTDSLPAGIAILLTLGSWPLFTIRDYVFSFTSLIKMLKSTEQKENLIASL